MRSRKEILKDLILLEGDIEILKKEIAQYDWDIEVPLFKIDFETFYTILKKSINNEIDFETLTNWANAIECRDDIEFVNTELQEIIFEIANPEINGEITMERLKQLPSKLQRPDWAISRKGKRG